MGTGQVVALANGLLHLEAVHDGEGDIVDKDGLNLSVHAFNLPQHSVEHLHVHTPLGSNSRIRVETLNDVGGAKNGNIRADSLDFLLTDPLGSKTLALGVGVSTGGRHIDKALDLRGVSDSLSNGHRDADVGLLEVLLLLVEDVGADARDGDVGCLEGELDFLLVSHILKLKIVLIAQIGRGLDLLEPVVPTTGHLTVGKGDLGTDTGKRTRSGDTKGR